MMKDYLLEIGLRQNHNLIVHSSLRKIRSAFPDISPTEIIRIVQEIIGESGSLIMPAFTYCFKSKEGTSEIFDRLNSPAKVGAIAEAFRTSNNVIRTSSPTHSFSLWGKITTEISSNNSPESPLGKDSVLDWLSKEEDSFVLMLGTHFDSLSFGHYLEIKAKVPWYDFFPWEYLGKEKIGVSLSGEQSLKEIPGCSKSFTKFETYLLDNGLIHPKKINRADFLLHTCQIIIGDWSSLFPK